MYEPTWIRTNCILASWRPWHYQSGHMKIPMKQNLAYAKDNLLHADEAKQGGPISYLE